MIVSRPAAAAPAISPGMLAARPRVTTAEADGGAGLGMDSARRTIRNENRGPIRLQLTPRQSAVGRSGNIGEWIYRAVIIKPLLRALKRFLS